MIVEIKDKTNWKIVTYKSLHSLTTFLNKNENTKTNLYSSHTRDEEFAGTETFRGALNILKNGSKDIKDGLKKHVKVAIDKLRKELNTKPQGYVADVQGLFFDVAKVVEGEPEAWYRDPWDKVKKPRLSIPLVGSYNSSFEVETAIENSSEIIALIKALEDSGFEVEIAMIFPAEYVSTEGQHIYQEVMVKGFDESFNWNKLSAMLHPSFFRRIIFRDVELTFPDTLSPGYGRTSANTMKMFKGGENFLNIGDHDSISRFKDKVLYALKDKK